MSKQTWARRMVAGAVAGAAVVGTAWAGVGLVPVDGPAEGSAPTAGATRAAASLGTGPAIRNAPPDLSGLATRLRGGEFLVGSDVSSIAPRDERWQREGCSEMASNFPDEVTHLADKAVADHAGSWPKSPDCVYLGGYGIGPARAASGYDEVNGVNVRTLAVSNGRDTFIWQMVDMVGFFARYRPDLCEGCGILDIRRRIAADTKGKIPVENVAIGSTHTHGGADGYGAWGGIPDWYRTQIADDIAASAYAAMRAMQPARIETGSVDARAFNNERRDTYYSTPDYGAVWLQAKATKGHGVIATLVNYAAHPVVLGDDNDLIHGDWPATASTALARRLGGTAMIVEGGLGNVSPNTPTDTSKIDADGDGKPGTDYDEATRMGEDFAEFIARDIARGGTALTSNEMGAVTVGVEHPITNWLETGLGIAGLLDREFVLGDGAGAGGAYEFRKNEMSPRACAAVGPITVKTDVSGFRLGGLTVVTGPGELFSAATALAKSKGRRAAFDGGQTMVFAQTQDSLGYIIQSFEADPIGGAAEYVPEVDLAEYEETFMLDRCFGDHVVEAQLDVLRQLDTLKTD